MGLNFGSGFTFRATLYFLGCFASFRVAGMCGFGGSSLWVVTLSTAPLKDSLTMKKSILLQLPCDDLLVPRLRKRSQAQGVWCERVLEQAGRAALSFALLFWRHVLLQ